MVTSAKKKKKRKEKCYFMYIYISLSSGQTVTTDFMVYGNKGMAREDCQLEREEGYFHVKFLH